MKRILLTAILLTLFCSAAEAEDIRVQCGKLTMNVPSENVTCYQIDESFPVPEDSDDSVLAGTQIASTALHISAFEKASWLEPEVTYYNVNELSNTDLRLYDIALDLSDLNMNLSNGESDIESDIEFFSILPYQANERTAQGFVAPLSFTGGKGYRMVACYEDTVKSYAESNLFYTFQAISSDEEYVITGVVPLTISELDGKDPAEIDWNSVTEIDFSPSIKDLDAYFSTIVFD